MRFVFGGLTCLLLWATPGLGQETPPPGEETPGDPNPGPPSDADPGDEGGGEAEKSGLESPSPAGTEAEREGNPDEAPAQEELQPKAPPLPVSATTGAPGSGPDGSVPGPGPASKPSSPHPAVHWPLSIEAIEQHLRGIAASHPEVALLEELGTSAAGRAILALRLGPVDPSSPADRPVLLLADYQGSGSAGPEAMLQLAWEMVSGYASDQTVRDLLGRASLVIAPALDPDVRAGPTEAPPRVRFENNFPSGWQPESLRLGSGRISLSKPECLAVVRFLSRLEGCAVVLGFAPSAPRGTPYAEALLPDADKEVFGKMGAALELEGASSLVPWYELGSPGGGLFDFAYQARGVYPLVFPLPAEDQLADGGLEAFEMEVAARVMRCMTLLPRIEITQRGLERLASDTWQLDVRIQNVGIVPTSSALANRRDPQADVVLRLDGAKLVATAKKPTDEADFTDPSFQVRAPLSGGTLAGGEGRWLRLLLEAASGSEVRVTASSLWAGSDFLQVRLP